MYITSCYCAHLVLLGFDYGGSGNYPPSIPGGNGQCSMELKSFLFQVLPSSYLEDHFYFTMLDHVTNNDYFLSVVPIPASENITYFFDVLEDTLLYLYNNRNEFNENNSNMYNFDMWWLVYNQTGANARDQLIYGPKCNFDYIHCEDINYLLNNRDEQMAMNLLYYLNNKGMDSFFPTINLNSRKIMVWTHNSHIIRNINNYPDAGRQMKINNQNGDLGVCKSDTPCLLRRAGQIVHDNIYNKQDMYAIASIAFNGTSGCDTSPCGDLTPFMYIYSSYGSLEHMFHQANFHGASFLDLSETLYPLPSWLRNDLISIALDNYALGKQAVLFGMYDGVMYYDQMAGITCYNSTANTAIVNN